jgi:Uma2 family endonuclease
VTATQSLLEAAGVRDPVHPLSVEAYHALGEMGGFGEKVELLRGIVVDKVSKSPFHTVIVRSLARLLASFLSRNPELALLKEDPLTLRDSEPEPDLAIVDAAEAEDRRRHPASAYLVIEVAISSLEIDRQKALIYAESGISEFWLVRPAQGEIDVFSGPEDGQYRNRRTLTADDTLTCGVFPGLSFPVEELLRESAGT